MSSIHKSFCALTDKSLYARLREAIDGLAEAEEEES